MGDPTPDIPAFQHSPLGDHEIRLLESVPTEGPGLHCRLHHFQLKQAPPYTAVSYRWGDLSGPRVHVMVNSGAFLLLENAGDALQQLKNHGDTTYIWIDCICIDQSNDIEKGHQVGLMSKIFSNAKETVVWLGKDDLLIGTALERLEHFTILEKPGREDTDNVCEAIAPLLLHEYWTRLWVIQELAMSASLAVLCGNHRMSWACIEDFFMKRWPYMVAKYPWNPETKEACVAALNMIHTTNFRRMDLGKYQSPDPRIAKHASEQDLTLEQLVSDFRHARCSDPRDKIFGLLSIYNSARRNKEAPPLLPDYTASTECLVLYYTAYMIEEKQSLLVNEFGLVKLLIQVLNDEADEEPSIEWVFREFKEEIEEQNSFLRKQQKQRKKEESLKRRQLQLQKTSGQRANVTPSDSIDGDTK